MNWLLVMPNDFPIRIRLRDMMENREVRFVTPQTGYYSLTSLCSPPEQYTEVTIEKRL